MLSTSRGEMETEEVMILVAGVLIAFALMAAASLSIENSIVQALQHAFN